MNGVMSNSRGKETYVVILRRSLAECSNRWTEEWDGRWEEWRAGGRRGEEFFLIYIFIYK